MLILWFPTISIVMNVMLVLKLNLPVDFHYSVTILGNAELVVQLYSCQKRLLNEATNRINYQCFPQAPAVDQTASHFSTLL